MEFFWEKNITKTLQEQMEEERKGKMNKKGEKMEE